MKKMFLLLLASAIISLPVQAVQISLRRLGGPSVVVEIEVGFSVGQIKEQILMPGSRILLNGRELLDGVVFSEDLLGRIVRGESLILVEQVRPAAPEGREGRLLGEIERRLDAARQELDAASRAIEIHRGRR